ncbi:Aldo/keto reductase [Panus rudis PR-1116 ss-1]|nr:Aldo/keto reductase [Panus rudis PR-1116 ss-1]
MSELRIPLNDGNSIPWLAFGTGTALYQKEAKDQVLQAISSGIVHLDGAQLYANEESLGDAIVQSGVAREKLYVTTKLGPVPEGKTVRDTLEESLKKLKIDYVDLFLIHIPKQHADLKGVWKQLEALKKEGLAKSIGVSNFHIQDFEKILPDAEFIPAVNQIEYHPYVFKASKPLIDYLKSKKIVPTSYGGLSPITRHKGGPLDPVLEKIAKRLGDTRGKPVTPGQVLQVWLRQQEIPAITTSSKLERLREYLDVVNIPDLTAEEVKEIEEVGSKVHHRVFATVIDTSNDPKL